MMQRRKVTIPSPGGQAIDGCLDLPPSGRGPGLLVLPDDRREDQAHLGDFATRLAEEGYVVLVPMFASAAQAKPSASAASSLGGLDELSSLLSALRGMPEVLGGIGAVGFGTGGGLALLAASKSLVDCAVAYDPVDLSEDLRTEWSGIRVPFALHRAPGNTDLDRLRGVANANDRAALHVYPDAGTGWFIPGHAGYDAASANIAYQRTVGLFRSVLGPYFDFSTLWDQHCACEFSERDVDATMATMVSQPYVNHIPTMTGGVGYHQLKRFYQFHFIPKTPADTRLIPVSRTVGPTSLVDEMLFCFTHDIEMDWMLPGLAPTGRYVEIPLVAIVRFRGDKLYNEHIYWDQASVLVQIGRLDPTGLPLAGIETAKKLMDETLPSNTLMARWVDSEGQST